MSYWLTDHDLFLYAKGPDDVILRRCKKLASSSSSGSSLVVPMKSDDFDYVSNVENHLELIGRMSDWEEPDYKRLVKYIYEKRLLVNGEGLVIAELLPKGDKDGKKTIDDVNEEDVPAIYIRSLDVLPLNSYIPKISERPIPLRTVKYLGDVNGKAAMMEEKDFNVITKLTARVDDLESKNKTLDTNVTKLTAGQVVMTDDIESKNKTLEGKVTKLTADLSTQMDALTTLQRQLNLVLEINANYKQEAWMNDLTNSKWVGIEGLPSAGSTADVVINNGMGIFTVDDSTTNVRARYWYKIKLTTSPTGVNFIGICLEDFTLNKERARFSPDRWMSFTSKGKTYVYRSMKF